MTRLSPTKMIITVIMSCLGIAFLLPFIWMLSASLKPEADVFNYPVEWIPQHWNTVQNYKAVWMGKSPFPLFYWNSLKVTGITTCLSIVISCMAGYGFSKIDFKGKNVLFLLLLCTYMIPHEAILVPQFIFYRWLQLFDSHTGLILLGSFSVLGTFLLRQFFIGINKELLESAKLDGAGHYRTFLYIGIPLVRPAIATYAILRFIWSWNDYQNPLIFLRSEHLYTLQLGIQSFADENGQFYSLIMAGTVSAIIPLLVIFVIGQRQVIEGISLGGVKG
ncbi:MULTISPECIES: carbohydrate ABC transporter permease [unclassified Paenibacillus]|uniref:carbohydrate ABC transporter permease n=1 Tax=unclassified Paenibacillus TaxID=185978 RepID=UPI003642FA9E